MYAPDHARAAAALVRCCAPGGRIVSAAWTPDGLMAATNRAMSPYLPPPPADGRPPARWGDETCLRGLFAGHEVAVSTELVSFTFESPLAAAEFWVRTAGHVQAERDRLLFHGDAWLDLHHALADVFTAWNRADGEGVRVEAAYLLAEISPVPGADHEHAARP